MQKSQFLCDLESVGGITERTLQPETWSSSNPTQVILLLALSLFLYELENSKFIQIFYTDTDPKMN